MEHVDYLERVSHESDPQMPGAFGWPHAIRAILERIEASDDLTDATSEEEIAQLAARRLKKHYGQRAPRTSVSTSVASPAQPAYRRVYRSILPETGRCRSGRRPRSDHG